MSSIVWPDLPAAQQPVWPDDAALQAVLAELRTQPPLVFAGECDILATEHGLVAEDGRINGYANLSVKYWTLWRSFCAELGLSPCSRARLKAPNSRPDINEFESFLKQA